MTFAEVMLRGALNGQMAALEKALRENGAGEWKAYIVTYHPEIEGAWIVVEGKGATIEAAKDILEKASLPDAKVVLPKESNET